MLRTRVITALILLAVILPAIFSPHPTAWAIVTLGFMAAAAWEWAGMLEAPLSGVTAAVVVVALGAAWLLAATAWPALADTLGLALVAAATLYWIMIAPWRLYRHDVRSGGRLLEPVVALGLLLATWVALLQLRDLGALVLIVAMALVWLADVGAYFIGRAFGRRKLAPGISPGKSWEGALGGALCVAVLGLVLAAAPGLEHALPQRLVGTWGPLLAILVFLAYAALSVLGDLHESLLKRQAGVKDSGRTLPGHGGVLDRIDAMLATMPFAALLHRIL